ncbi:MAG: AAA family ATPase [Patescibacteria group bacterium]|jgi:predicted kinase
MVNYCYKEELRFTGELIVPIGLPGSGKSTHRTKLQARYGPRFKVISPDEIRMCLLDYEKTGKSFDESIEPIVWKFAYHYLQNAMYDKTAIIYFDATNLTHKKRQVLLDMANANGFKTRAIVFQCPLWLAMMRNKSRKRKVPDNVISQMATIMTMPNEEGFSIFEICVMEPTPKERSIIAKYCCQQKNKQASDPLEE